MSKTRSVTRLIPSLCSCRIGPCYSNGLNSARQGPITMDRVTDAARIKKSIAFSSTTLATVRCRPVIG